MVSGLLPPRPLTRRPARATRAAEIPLLFRERSARAAVWKVAWPSVAIGLLRTALGQVDAYQIGRLGSVELQAIGAASFAIWLVYILGELSSIGVHALTSEAEGAGDRRGIAEAITQGMWFSLVTSALALLLSRARLIDAYFNFVGVQSRAVRDAGRAYVYVTSAFGALPLSASACASAGFKGIGETRPALWIAAMTVVVNAALNVPFIARWGVAGAAWATNVAAALACAVSLYVLRNVHDVKVGWRPPSLSAMRRIAAIGAPLASSGALFTFVYVVLGRLLASLDPAYLAAIGVGHRIEAVAYTVAEGFGVGTATCVGMWLGARRPREARSNADAASQVAVLSMLPISLVMAGAAPLAVKILACNDKVVADAAISYLRIVSLVFPLMAIESVYEGACIGAQQTFWPFVVTLVGSCARIPLAIFLLRYFGVTGIWFSIALTSVFKAPAKYLVFKRANLDNTTR